MKQPILRIININKRYTFEDGGEINALRDISFDLYNNEILGIIGPSGGGKTTLLRIIHGSEPFDSGEIQIDHICIRPSSTEEEIQKLLNMTSIHLQRSVSLWDTTVFDNIIRRFIALDTGDETLPLAYEEKKYKKWERAAINLLKVVELEHKIDHPVATLSGGEKQRVVLARQLATIGFRKIALIDEPLTMSDLNIRKKILKWMREMKDKTSMIITSHNPQLLYGTADRIMHLDGKIIDIGGEEVIKNFVNQMEEPLPLMPHTDKIVLEVKNLRKEYHFAGVDNKYFSVPFELKNISFKLYEKEILAIVGLTGVGKSVLLNLLTGEETPTDGDIIYFIKDKKMNIKEDKLKIVGNIGYIPQELDLPYTANIKDLAYARLGLIGERPIIFAKKRANKLDLKWDLIEPYFIKFINSESSTSEFLNDMKDVGLDEEKIKDLFIIPPWEADDLIDLIFNLLYLPTDVLQRRVYELSVGERVRVAIGIEILNKPKVLFLDEPFGDLDVVTLRTVCNTLKEINDKLGISMVLVSHQIDFIKEVAHRAIQLYNGEIIYVGNPENVTV
ncbi:ATP-binding cassette domain-containing protein [Candidatus Methanoliparum sp. LAM-1]|uniref:ATP-binding cassette domain-containing protein n=1 Tax=Candidatus Methanoliparum sp. LAM-1 TaxID=2874846 RepID=UPI001E5A2C75|nr:ATP-binding cassette domain-containing protein [Candidatus Methanoliparum sp. LAM-1]BDC35357.1 ABC transporter ATP-binding protein [Candidatus Methanoliparum sp. LAM-1]